MCGGTAKTIMTTRGQPAPLCVKGISHTNRRHWDTLTVSFTVATCGDIKIASHFMKHCPASLLLVVQVGHVDRLLPPLWCKWPWHCAYAVRWCAERCFKMMWHELLTWQKTPLPTCPVGFVFCCHKNRWDVGDCCSWVTVYVYVCGQNNPQFSVL